MRRFIDLPVSAAFILLSLSAAVFAADWPQWRGLNRDGTSPETGLLKAWPEGGPPLEMKIEGLGAGITSVAVVNNRIYTLSQVDDEEYAVALERTTGERIWVTSLGPAGRQIPLMRWLSQRTPTVDGDRLYAITAAGQLSCLDTSDGSLLWVKHYQKEYEGSGSPWGFCDYPLVDGEGLICTPGGRKASVVALNKQTGEQIWSTLLPSEPKSAHSATLKGAIDDLEFYVTFMNNGLFGVAADDGRMLWQYHEKSWRTANSHTPLLFKDHLVITNGYGSGVTLLKLKTSGAEMSVERVYYQKIGLDAFQDNTLPLGKDALLVNRGGVTSCLNLMTGELLWNVRVRGARGAMILADGSFYQRSADGNVTLNRVDRGGHELIGQFQLPETEPQRGGTAPVISDGRLYIRDNDRLFVYDIRKRENDLLATGPKIVSLPPVENSKTTRESRVPYPIYLPTPQDVVASMLKAAGVGKDTTLVDLGSGDGRIVIAAAKQHGAKAIGYEIDEELVDISRKTIAEQKLEKLARIEASDMYKADLSDADVVAVFLYPAVLNKLKPQFGKMKDGAMIVSHQFPIPGIKPEKVLMTKSEETGQEHRILLYRLPVRERKE